MSLASQVSLLATRAGQECKSLWTAVNGKAVKNEPADMASPDAYAQLWEGDGMGGVWSNEVWGVDVSGIWGMYTLDQLGASSVPAGVVESFAGVVVPTGYLACDGSAISRTTYAALWQALSFQFTGTTTNASNQITAIAMTRGALANVAIGMPISGPNIPAGTTVSAINTGTSTITMSANATAGATSTIHVAPNGIGDGSTTFNVPDGRGRAQVGMGTSRRLGLTDGVAEASRFANWSHSHSHGSGGSASSDSAGTPSGTVGSTAPAVTAGTEPDHSHSFSASPSVSIAATTLTVSTAANTTTGGTGARVVSATGTTAGNHSHAGSSVSIGGSVGSGGGHTHTISGTSHSHTFTGSALGTHTHTISVGISSNNSGDHPHLSVNFIIKT